MKKDTTEKKPLKQTLINIGLVLVTLLVSGAIGYFLILPTFNDLSSINEKISVEKGQADKIGLSIANLKSQDKNTLATISAIFKSLAPTQIDMLHFASLNETIARAVGAEVTSIQIAKIVPPSSSKAPTKAVGSQVSATNISATYKSNFDSLLRLIRAWMLADQEVGVKTIQIVGTTTGLVTYTVTYDLPTSQPTPTVSIDDQLVLSKKQLEELKAVKAKIVYTATPSANPLGHNNPFSQ